MIYTSSINLHNVKIPTKKVELSRSNFRFTVIFLEGKSKNYDHAVKKTMWSATPMHSIVQGISDRFTLTF